MSQRHKDYYCFVKAIVATNHAQPTTPEFGVMLLWCVFGRKGRFKGRFCDPPKSENGSHIALLSIDRHVDPPKMVKICLWEGVL